MWRKCTKNEEIEFGREVILDIGTKSFSQVPAMLTSLSCR